MIVLNILRYLCQNKQNSYAALRFENDKICIYFVDILFLRPSQKTLFFQNLFEIISSDISNVYHKDHTLNI